MARNVSYDEPFSIRMALKFLDRAYDQMAVRRLRLRLRYIEKTRDITILLEKPLRVTLNQLKKYTPDLFYIREPITEKQIKQALYRVLKDSGLGK